MESKSSAPSFTWPLAPSKPRVRTPITAKPVGQAPLAPLPRVPRASVPPPMVAEPVRVEPPPIFVEPEPATVEDEVLPDHAVLDAMPAFGAGVLSARRGTNKFFLFAVLLAALASAALVLLR